MLSAEFELSSTLVRALDQIHSTVELSHEDDLVDQGCVLSLVECKEVP